MGGQWDRTEIARPRGTCHSQAQKKPRDSWGPGFLPAQVREQQAGRSKGCSHPGAAPEARSPSLRLQDAVLSKVEGGSFLPLQLLVAQTVRARGCVRSSTFLGRQGPPQRPRCNAVTARRTLLPNTAASLTEGFHTSLLGGTI